MKAKQSIPNKPQYDTNLKGFYDFIKNQNIFLPLLLNQKGKALWDGNEAKIINASLLNLLKENRSLEIDLFIQFIIQTRYPELELELYFKQFLEKLDNCVRANPEIEKFLSIHQKTIQNLKNLFMQNYQQVDHFLKKNHVFFVLPLYPNLLNRFLRYLGKTDKKLLNIFFNISEQIDFRLNHTPNLKIKFQFLIEQLEDLYKEKKDLLIQFFMSPSQQLKHQLDAKEIKNQLRVNGLLIQNFNFEDFLLNEGITICEIYFNNLTSIQLLSKTYEVWFSQKKAWFPLNYPMPSRSNIEDLHRIKKQFIPTRMRPPLLSHKEIKQLPISQADESAHMPLNLSIFKSAPDAKEELQKADGVKPKISQADNAEGSSPSSSSNQPASDAPLPDSRDQDSIGKSFGN